MLVKDQDGSIREVPLARPQEGQKAWIDIDGTSAVTLRDVLAILGWDNQTLDILDLSPSRAQLQYLGPLSILSVFVPENDAVKNIGIILGPGVIVTIHHDPVALLAELAHEVAGKTELIDSAHYLLYEILERISETFLELMDRYEEEFDQLEEDVLNGHDKAHDVFGLRHKLHHQRSILADMRRIAARLSRRQFVQTSTGVPDANIFIDVYDAFYHVMDNIDSLRDNLTGLVDLQLNQRSTRLNEIMKFLTIFSTIFLPLSFITGFFGMNYIRSMPELNVPLGQEWVILLMVGVAASMLVVFKIRKWM